MISRNTIDKVFEAARVEEVIGDFVQLKKSGSGFKGLSPFTNERTPSFSVSPVKQIWKDFSSGKGGNVIAFLMEYEHFSYPEAIKYLANKYGIEIEETVQTDEQKEQANERESLYLVSDFAKKYFHNTLLNSEEGKAIGLTYFKERGFTQETIADFMLGYSPDKWDAFTSKAIKDGYKVEFLEKTGLTIVKGEKQFDRFKGRVIFPILSMTGRTLGFGGRILTNEKKAAKYLNSPESVIYHKSKVLYGIFQAKQAIAKQDNCYLVEGYTDVIQFYQTGIKNVVSSSGTALTTDQVRLISRLTKNITVLFDGDAAGLRASNRGIDLILEQGMNVKVCTFPEGEDPDSFAKKNNLDSLTEFLNENAQDFIKFKASLLAAEGKNDPTKKADTVREMVVSIAKIDNAIKQEIYIKECSKIMDISEEVLFNTLAQILSNETKKAVQKTKTTSKPFDVVSSGNSVVEKVDHQFELEKKIIELLLLYGNEEVMFEDEIIEEDEKGKGMEVDIQYTSKVYRKIFLDLQEDEIEFTNEEFKAIYFDIVEGYLQDSKFKLDVFISTLEPEKASVITDIIMDEEKYKLANWEGRDIYIKSKKDTLSQMVSETILNLRRQLVSLKIEGLANEIKNHENEELKKEVLEAAINYTVLKKRISERLNRVL